MTINKNVKYYRKIIENQWSILLKLLISQKLVSLSYRTWFWIDAKINSFYPLVQRQSNLILIFMIIKENIRNHRKITENAVDVPTTLLISQLLTAIEKQTGYQNNAKALLGIIKFSLLEISELQNHLVY